MILPSLVKTVKSPASLNIFRSSVIRNGSAFGLLNRLPVGVSGNTGLSVQNRAAPTLLSRSFSSQRQLFNEAKNSATKNGLSETSNWSDFFAYRVQIRRMSVLASIFSSLVGGLIGWSYIGMIEIDPTQEIFGFDPFMVYGAGLMVAIGFSSMFGPSLNDLGLRLFQNAKYKQYQIKNSQFLKRISKNRVDPSFQSLSNPVPDYYGEKINSLKEYRRWLRDCNTYRKKRETEV